MKIDIAILSLIVGTVIPFLVALVTKQSASSGVKAVANFALSAVAAVVTAAISNDGLLTQQVALGAFLTFLSSGSFYNHLFKPLGATQVVAEATADFGVGGA